MESRFLITGEQLVLLTEAPENEVANESHKIREDQFVGASNKSILEDVRLVRHFLRE